MTSKLQELPARPMRQLELAADRLLQDPEALLSSLLRHQPRDSILRLKIRGRLPRVAAATLRAPVLRTLAPPTMNVSVRLTHDPTFRLDT